MEHANTKEVDIRHIKTRIELSTNFNDQDNIIYNFSHIATNFLWSIGIRGGVLGVNNMMSISDKEGISYSYDGTVAMLSSPKLARGIYSFSDISISFVPKMNVITALFQVVDDKVVEKFAKEFLSQGDKISAESLGKIFIQNCGNISDIEKNNIEKNHTEILNENITTSITVEIDTEEPAISTLSTFTIFQKGSPSSCLLEAYKTYGVEKARSLFTESEAW